MEKPDGYENTLAAGSYEVANLGGHYMVIKGVEEKQTRTGKPMLVVFFDFDSNDAQSSMFKNAYISDTRQEKKWPRQGTDYIVAEDNEGKCTRNFKGFITSVENSNAGFKIIWGQDFGYQLKGKKVGGVFGIEKDYYNGRPSEKHVLRYYCDLDKVSDAKIPNPVETIAYRDFMGWQSGGINYEPSKANADGFMDIPDNIDEELPFN